jgi:hypothetical protein
LLCGLFNNDVGSTDYIPSNSKIHECIRNDVEGNDRGLFQRKSGHLPGGREENNENPPIRKVGVQDEIRIGRLPNTNPKRYRLRQLARTCCLVVW